MNREEIKRNLTELLLNHFDELKRFRDGATGEDETSEKILQYLEDNNLLCIHTDWQKFAKDYLAKRSAPDIPPGLIQDDMDDLERYTRDD